VNECNDDDRKDSFFYFHQTWASAAIQEAPLENEDELRALVQLVISRNEVEPVKLILEDDSSNGVNDHAWYDPETQNIHVKRGHMLPSVVLHELAHYLTRGQSPPWHGRAMLDCFLELVEEFIGEEAHATFSREFRDFRNSRREDC
jgi:hypothetical protein